MQINSHFFLINLYYSAHLPNKMRFFGKKRMKHLQKRQKNRIFVAEFIASAMAVPSGVRGIALSCEGNQPL